MSESTQPYVFIVVRDANGDEVTRLECVNREQANRMRNDRDLVPLRPGEYTVIEEVPADV